MRRYIAVAARGTTCSRQYGYTLAVNPPIVLRILGDDIEGYGWWVYPQPKTRTIRHSGWYRYKSDALKRADELNK